MRRVYIGLLVLAFFFFLSPYLTNILSLSPTLPVCFYLTIP